jgi:hypothetical protein
MSTYRMPHSVVRGIAAVKMTMEVTLAVDRGGL